MKSITLVPVTIMSHEQNMHHHLISFAINTRISCKLSINFSMLTLE